MKQTDWNSVSVNCRFDQSDQITEVLEEFGAGSVSVLAPDDDDRTTVTALYELDGLDLDQLFSDLEKFQHDDRQFQITQEILHGRDWVKESQDKFEPILVNDEMWIVSPWHKVDDSEAKVVTINPGMSFGTGHHPTTRMCLEFLAKHDLSDCEVVDFGCGSGILALAALKLGCRFAWGVDMDNDALDESTDNAERNDLSFRFMAVHPNSLPSDISADLILANLHLDILLELTGTLKSFLSESGWLVMSGILRSQVEQVQSAYEDTFDLEVKFEGNWAMISGEKGS